MKRTAAIRIMRFNSLCEILDHYSRLQPDAAAIIYDDRKWSFCELAAEVSARADVFRQSGKTCLAVLCDSSADCVMNIFAANQAGLQVVMLDETLPEDLLDALLRYSDADMLWTADEELAVILKTALKKPASKNTTEKCSSDEQSDDITAAETIAQPSDTAGNILLAGNQLQYKPSGKLSPCVQKSEFSDRILFFTSGTTSRSKAVVLTGKSLCSSAWNGSQMLPLEPGDTLLCCLPLAHVFGFVCGLLWGLSCGACVALGRGPRHYIDDYAFYKPTAVSLVPSLLAFLLKAKAFGPELKNILIGAGDCPQHLIDAVKATGIAVSFGYGLTETSSGVAISTGGDPYAMDICQDDIITIAPDGEVLIQAPTCIMQGYYKDPVSTAEVLKDGVLYSGDLGFIDENGRLHITGRKKDMLVMPDGTKIFLPEYEADLAAVLGQTEFAVDLNAGRPVLIVCKEPFGKAEETASDLYAEPDAKSHTEVFRSDILKIIRPVMEKLPRGQQITDIIFTEGPLPRTATGKLKRWEIRQKASLK